MMILNVRWLSYLFCLLILFVGFKGYASQDPEKVYEGLSMMPFETLPSMVSYEGISVYKSELGEYILKVRLIKSPIIETKEDSFMFNNTFATPYLEFVNTLFSSSVTSGEAPQFQFKGQQNHGHILIAGKVDGRNTFTGANGHFQRFLGSITRTGSRLDSTRKEHFQDIMQALDAYKPTRTNDIEKAYEEIVYIEKELLPRLLRSGKALATTIGNDGMNGIPGIANTLGLYKVLLEREYERRYGKSIQSVFSPNSTENTVEIPVSSETASTLKTVFKAIEAEQPSHKPTKSYLTTILGVTSFVVAGLGFIFLLHALYKKQFS